MENRVSLVRPRQRDRLLALLKNRAPALVPLPDILALGIAQYNTRILELRRLGHRIESKQECGRSWFRLVTNPVPSAVGSEPQPKQESIAITELVGGDVAPERHRDDG